MADIKTVFIDGEAGTTGLQIRERLAGETSIRVLSIAPDKRKDADARRALMAEADLAVLCLPDDAAKEAVALADELGAKAPKIVDASTAHRVAADWVYGFPELAPQGAQAALIARAGRVANPGCYATGAIALLRPIMEAKFLPANFPVTVNAVSGYTGGGKSMIAEYESGKGPAFELYGLGLSHKHLPEIVKHAGLAATPLFVPSVAAFAQGMLVSIPLPLSHLSSRPTASDFDELLKAYYDQPGSRVTYHYNSEDSAYHSGRLSVDPARDRDDIEIWTFHNGREDQILLVARLDNLGKGAAGAAVQNIRLMLGVDARG